MAGLRHKAEKPFKYQDIDAFAEDHGILEIADELMSLIMCNAHFSKNKDAKEVKSAIASFAFEVVDCKFRVEVLQDFWEAVDENISEVGAPVFDNVFDTGALVKLIFTEDKDCITAMPEYLYSMSLTVGRIIGIYYKKVALPELYNAWVDEEIKSRMFLISGD